MQIEFLKKITNTNTNIDNDTNLIMDVSTEIDTYTEMDTEMITSTECNNNPNNFNIDNEHKKNIFNTNQNANQNTNQNPNNNKMNQQVCSYGLICFYKKKTVVKDTQIVNNLLNRKTKKTGNSLCNTNNLL